MPQELSALMIKTSRNPAALHPEMQQLPFSSISATTRGLLADVAERHPGAIGAGEAGGAMLTPPQAEQMTAIWQSQIEEGVFQTTCQTTQGYVAEMADLARKGFSMILIEH